MKILKILSIFSMDINKLNFGNGLQVWWWCCGQEEIDFAQS